MIRRNQMEMEIGMEIGLLVGLLFVNILFQFLPGTELGRLSTRTMENGMQAVDAFLPYDSSVEEQQQDLVEELTAVEEQVQQVIDEVKLDVTISLGPDTIGLNTVGTFENTSHGQIGTGEIGPPGFMPAEILPNCTYMPPPEYPEIARLAGVEGVVTLWVYIDSNGILQDVQLMNTSGIASLDQAALSAAVNTRWTSARNNGLPVAVWTTLNYNFSLLD